MISAMTTIFLSALESLVVKSEPALAEFVLKELDRSMSLLGAYITKKRREAENDKELYPESN